MSVKNNYLIKNLDSLLDLSAAVNKQYTQFTSELIHSSFLIAYDKKLNPIILSVGNRDYAFIFSSPEEFKKAFPDEDPCAEFEFTILMDIFKQYKLEGFILNVSSQNFYITKNMLKGLNNLPSALISSNKTYTPEELKILRYSIDNHSLEDFISNPGNYMEFFKIMSSAVLFALIESEKDLDVLECDGMIETFGITDKYDYYNQDHYIAVFTREEKIKNIETSKFRYMSLVNFAVLVHYSIKQEFRGIIINPDDEGYVIPVEVLIKNWSLINQTCWDERLASAQYNIFMMD